jgi:uncharacterized protein (DUF433 family)
MISITLSFCTLRGRNFSGFRSRTLAQRPLLAYALKCWPEVRIKLNIKWQNHVESTPNVLRGKPRIKGTRIPVSLILGYLASGNTPEQIISEFPDLNHDQIAACLDYARALAEFEVVV